MDFYWINRCFVSIQFAPLICRDFELSRFSGFWIGYLLACGLFFATAKKSIGGIVLVA